MDLGDGEPFRPMQPDCRPHRAKHEGEVLAEVGPESGALMALDVEVADPDTGELGVDRIVLAPETDHVDRPPRLGERLGLPADPWVLLVVGMHDHQGRPAPRGHALVDQPAPRRRTCRSRVDRPCELSTVSTIEAGSVVDGRPVDRRMGGDHDHDVGPAQELVQGGLLTHGPGGIGV